MPTNKCALAPKTPIEEYNWLRLARSQNISDAAFWQLLKRYGSAERALKALPAIIAQNRRKAAIHIANHEDIERELSAAAKHGMKYLFAGQKNYPELLYQIPYAPPVLSVYGNIAQLAKPAVTVVGSRKATNTGMQLSASFSSSIGEAGFNIVSGLAAGIDTAAHHAALNTGTIAVLAGGINHIYPRENTRLYYEIIDSGGLIISEHSLDYEPRTSDFPKRNRIVAGLSIAMVVIEASRRSGTLISARLAAQYNRLVFAIPQNILNIRAQGNNELLKAGAMVALTPMDVIESLLPLTHQKTKGQLCFFEAPSRDLIEQTELESFPSMTDIDMNLVDQVLENLTYTGANAKTLAFLTQADYAEIENILLYLEIIGKISRFADGRSSRRIPL